MKYLIDIHQNLTYTEIVHEMNKGTCQQDIVPPPKYQSNVV